MSLLSRRGHPFDDYVEQQLDKAICIGDEVLWINNPEKETQDSDTKEQETND